VSESGSTISDKEITHLAAAGAMYLREYARDVPIYQWMKDNGLGESAYGSIMDAVGRRPGIFDHRHFGHHLIYDFPIGELSNAPDFLEHLLISDLFTKQGIPIVPGELLELAGIREYCSVKTLQWNFVNAFDVLSGTLAIYAGYKNLKTYSDGQTSIESFTELAKQLGIGALELAIAVSTKNPFLLLGATLQLAGTMKGVFTSPTKAYFRKIAGQYVLVFSPIDLSMESLWKEYEFSLNNAWRKHEFSLKNVWGEYELSAKNL